MADKEQKFPNTRPDAQAVKEILASPIPGQMEDGVRIITYSLTAPPDPQYMTFGVTALSPVVDKGQVEAVEAALAEIERVANVKFRRVNDGNPDIALFNGNGMQKAAGYEIERNNTRAVVLDPRYFDDVLLHEICHALGLDHPDHKNQSKQNQTATLFTGSSPAYNKDGTVMSYNLGAITRDRRHLGHYDIAALQEGYGKPADTSPDKHSTIGTETKPITLYSENPITLTVSSGFTRDIILPEPDVPGVRSIGERVRLASGTNVANVVMDPGHTGGRIAGNSLNNVLQGSGGKDILLGRDGDDRLIAVGEGDELRGGAGRDSFVLQSGATRVIIADMSAGESLELPPETNMVRMKQVEKEGKPGTVLFAYDANQTIVGSAFVRGLTPDEVRPMVVGQEKMEFKVQVPLPVLLKEQTSQPVVQESARASGNPPVVTSPMSAELPETVSPPVPQVLQRATPPETPISVDDVRVQIPRSSSPAVPPTVSTVVPEVPSQANNGALEKAVNALKKLDIGYDENVRNGSITTAVNGKKVSDNAIGMNEMARISDTAASGYQWGSQDMRASRNRRDELLKALDLNSDGSTTHQEIHEAAEAAKKAGMKFDGAALEQVLQTGNIPMRSNPQKIVK